MNKIGDWSRVELAKQWTMIVAEIDGQVCQAIVGEPHFDEAFVAQFADRLKTDEFLRELMLRILRVDRKFPNTVTVLQ